MELMIIEERNVLGQEFRVYGTVENPLFLAKDVAAWIEYDTSSLNKMLAAVDENEKVRKIVPTLGGPQEMWFLTEDGLYEVLMQSRKPIAKEFKRQVKTILREIRLNKGYVRDGSEIEFLRRSFEWMTEDTLRQVTREYCQRNAALQSQNDALNDTVRLLSDEALEWADRSFIVALIRRYSINLFTGSAQYRLKRGWGEFYQRLEYGEEGISLKKRRVERGPKPDQMSLLNFLSDSEISYAVKIAAAMCVEKGLDISDHILKLREPEKKGVMLGSPSFAMAGA